MPFWPAPAICYCDSCKKRWAEEEGRDVPRNPAPGSAEYELLSKKRYQWMGEWTQKVSDYVRAKSPEMAVYHNGASLVAGGTNNGCGESVNDACDFCGGDLYGDYYNQSFACKTYKNITKNPPFEYMFSRCKPALRVHTMTKSLDEMKTAIAVTASHHGATLVIDAIDPIGTFDKRVYDRFGEAFSLQIPYEPYFRGEMVEDIAIYYSIKSRFDATGCKATSLSGSVGASRMLIRNHIPYGVTGSYHRLEGYKAIIAPMLQAIESDDNARICEYVKNGGVIYLSGVGNKALIEELTGGRIGKRMSEKRLYISPKQEYEETFLGFNAKYPLPYDGVGFEIEGIDEIDVLATFTLPYTQSNERAFAAIHSDPPGVPTDIPAVICKRYGKGKVVWSSLPLECGETEEHGDILLSLLRRFADLDKPSFKTDAPDNVELTLFEGEGEMLVNCTVLHAGSRSYPVSPFSVRVRCETVPHSVALLPAGEHITFTYENGYVCFEARKLNIFDMYRIEL